MSGKRWSDEEIAIAKMIRDSGKTVKAMAHLLPGRPIGGIKHIVSQLGDKPKRRGETSVALIAALRLLEATPGLTIAELAQGTGFNHEHMCRKIRARHGNGLYIASWKVQYGHRIERWAVGDLPDAPMPPIQTIEERRRKDRVRWDIWGAKRKPFANMLMQLQGETHAPKGSTGRVYAQDMTGESLEDRRAA